VPDIFFAGYKYNFANELVADSYKHLSQFPSNPEITHELAVAETQAQKIALFAGIDPRFFTTLSTSTTSPNIIPNDNEDTNKGKC
jgi:hypothetical protein